MNQHCDNLRDALLLDDAGELAAGERAALERHLQTCAACRAYRDDLRALSELGRTPAAETDVSVFALHRIREAAGQAPRPGLLRLFRPALVYAAASLALLLGGTVLVRSLVDSDRRAELVVEPSPPPAGVSEEVLAWDYDIDTSLDRVEEILAWSTEGLTEFDSTEGLAGGADTDVDDLARELLRLEGAEI